MFAIPKKVSHRIDRAIPKFQKILKIAKNRDVNESDTVSIVNDMVSEIFGYDKYLEVTSELAIRGTYCDLAIKVNDKIQWLIECKAINLDLKNNHLKQAIDYGANKGIPWVVLTNGNQWQIYRIRFDQPIGYDLVCSINFEQLDGNLGRDLDILFVLCKEGIEKKAREDYFDKSQNINRFMVGNLLLNEPIVSALKKELRNISGNLKVSSDEIAEILRLEVIKREILDGEEAEPAQSKLSKFYRKKERSIKKKITEKIESTAAKNIESSVVLSAS